MNTQLQKIKILPISWPNIVCLTMGECKKQCTILRDYIQNKDMWNVCWAAKEGDLTANEYNQPELQKNNNALRCNTCWTSVFQ